MQEETIYTPQEAAAILQIGSSTLRRLAVAYASHLSDYANPTGETTHRRYTPGDITTLRRILDLKRRGVPEENIPAQLAVEPGSERIEAPESGSERTVAFSPMIALAQAQARQTEDVLARLRAVEAELTALRIQIARLEAAQHDHPGIVPKRPLK